MSDLTGAEHITWDLSDLYASPDDPELQRDRASIVRDAEAFASDYRGRIAQLDPGGMAGMLTRYESLIQRMHRMGSYAHLIWSTDTESAALGKLLQQSNELGSKVSQLLVFLDVEWLAMDEDAAARLIDTDQLAPYRHHLMLSRRFRSHTLSEQAEQVMSAKSVTGRSSWVRYFDETLGAARFSFQGEDLTEQQVLSKLHHPERHVRQEAHRALTDGFNAHRRTLTYIFNTVLADKASSDTLRGYANWIDSRHLSNQTDAATVDALIDTVTRAYPLAQRYYRLKTRLLGLDVMFDYDRYAPLTASRTTVPWDSARQRVLSAYHRFHPRMGEIAAEFFDKRWIDAAVRPGKRGGAYAASVSCDTHPYVFMNYNGQLRDVQTLAHELGHGVHQYLARRQGELQSGTPLTTAETASVFGEMLVFHDLLGTLSDPSERLALLLSKLDDTIATVFRQVSMNRFEERIHRHRREHGELSTEEFSDHWEATQTDLYGDSVTLTPGYRLWWCYIPHFLHTPGYVYAYAFGELLVLSLYKRYKESPEGFADAYLDMLSTGGARWPHEMIGELGLDIRDPGFWQRGVNEFEALITSAEEAAILAGLG